MALFEYYTRYLALRPLKNNQTIFLLNISMKNIFPTYAFLILAFSLAFTSSAKLSHPWHEFTVEGPVENVISDERDGSLYLVINSHIYKYNSEFQPMSSTQVATSSKVTVNETTSHDDLTNKLLLIVKKGGMDFLFSCWSTQDLNLVCWLNKINDLKFAAPLIWPPGSKGFRIDTIDQMKALYSQDDNNDLLIATSRLNFIEDSSKASYLPAISRFKIVKNAKHLSLEQKSVLPYKSRLEELVLYYDYVYLFNYDHFTYFILNDIRKPFIQPQSKENNHSARLAKICANDTDLTSYTEILLPCDGQDHLYAKLAYSNTTKENPMLYVLFDIIDDNSSQVKKSNDKSLLCAYSMALIDDIFNRVTTDCNQGNPSINLLEKCHLDSTQPLPCNNNPSYDWCTSKTNPYIDGTSQTFNSKEDFHLDLHGFGLINFIYPIEQGPDSKDVVFIGTETGFLTKISIDEELFYTIDLNRNQIKSYKIGEKINFKHELNVTSSRITRYFSDSRKIITTTTNSSSLNQLDTDACYYYSTCKTCLGTRDPLECVWCGDSCSLRSKCSVSNYSTSNCPPLIRSFSPKSGPTFGSTRLKIEGENFGTSSGNLTVLLGDNECLIDREISTDEIIECLTKPVNHTSSSTIKVNVSDQHDYIYSIGSTTSDQAFNYVKVKVYGLHPSRGFTLSQALVNIYGENLDSGSNRTVYIGNSICKIKHYDASKISCLHKSSSNDLKTQDHLKVLIDGYEQILSPRVHFGGHNLTTTYTYTNEPQSLDNIITVDELHDSEKSSYLSVFIVISLMTITSIILYLLCHRKFPQYRIKIPSLMTVGDKSSDAKVTYRNSQSHKFSHVELSPVNGLVKLNENVSSSDYFGKQDYIELDQPLINNFMDNEMLTLLKQEKILIERNRLTLGHVLGSGQFGRVYKGFLKVEELGDHVAVAVKTLHNKSTWNDAMDSRAFLEEGLMMKDFEHDNVLTLIGVTFDSGGLPMVITPFMLYGDLRSYISDEASSPTVKELIDYGTQIAKGMAYLSNLKFVHRDLAARNCMLDENLVVKVADFGLSRDIYERDYYSSDNKKTKLPVKWMAVESLEKCIYNTKTDVWSYGILLWELMTRGVTPYPDVDNFDLFSYLKEGRRMLRPRYCPMILYMIMLTCWDENPANRPTFEELVHRVSDVINQLKVAKDGQQKVSRDMTYCDVPK